MDVEEAYNTSSITHVRGIEDGRQRELHFSPQQDVDLLKAPWD